jgi:hypothetical protein
MASTNSSCDFLVQGTEYRIMHACKITSEDGIKLLLVLHTADHSLFCIFPTELGNMLTDLQIEHVNNKTRILTAIYDGKNPYGDMYFK